MCAGPPGCVLTGCSPCVLFLAMSQSGTPTQYARHACHATAALCRVTHSRVVLAAASQNAAAAGGGAFYDRDHERAQLHKLLMAPPARINVVLGPANSGKTALLQQYIQEQGNKGATISYLDCREVDVTSPAAFAETLSVRAIPALLRRLPPRVWTQSVLTKLVETVRAPGGMPLLRMFKATLSLSGPTVEADFDKAEKLVNAKATAESTSQSPITTILAAYTELLDVWAQARAARLIQGVGLSYPVLIIDEANKLMGWSERHPAELDILLSFFVATTKQKHRGHVVLATSEYAFQTWLTESECGRGHGFVHVSLCAVTRGAAFSLHWLCNARRSPFAVRPPSTDVSCLCTLPLLHRGALQGLAQTGMSQRWWATSRRTTPASLWRGTVTWTTSQWPA